MTEIDIKEIWKNYGGNKPEEKRYSLEEIQSYRRKRSKAASKSSRIGLLFDLGYKSIIMIGLIFLTLILNHQFPYQIVVASLIAITCVLIFAEIRFLKKLNKIKDSDPVIDNLKEKLNYFKSTHKKFIFTSALSNPILFVAGMFFYDHFKYGSIQTRAISDDFVIYIFLALSFFISLIGQWPFYKNQIKELEESIVDLDDIQTASEKIDAAKRRRRWFIIISSILVLLGVLLLLIIFNI